MKSTLQAMLVNPPSGDPGMLLRLRWQGRALLFDLGRIDGLDAGSLLRVTHVFVSHTHMDHFIGFDHLLRLVLARNARLGLFGPPGIIDNVRGKLSAYTWNLVDDYPLVIEVTEAAPTGTTSAVLRAATRFTVEQTDEKPVPGSPPLCLLDESGLRVEAVHLDHKIPCLAFRARESSHLNVNTQALSRLGLRPGPWLTRLKNAVRVQEEPDTTIEVSPGVRLPIDRLRSDLLIETPGQSVVYVTDAAFTAANIERILLLARGADLFVCEAAFLDADRERAADRAHLTARQAGALARWAGARHLRVFHFSPRHHCAQDEIEREAAAEFSGRETCYGDGPAG